MSPIKKLLYKNNYNFKEVAPEIFLIKNFLTKKEIKKIITLINSSSEEDWQTHYMNGVIGLAERKYGRSDIKNLLSEGLIEITDHWVDKNLGLNYEISEGISKRIRDIISFDESLYFDGVGTIQRQYEGAQLTEHVDNHADPMIEYAVIMYVNDDYSDGELFFSRLGLKIKPPARSLIIFPSGENYIHGVKSPGPGPVRYALPTFVNYSDFFDNMP